jgi:hypothetical protein
MKGYGMPSPNLPMTGNDPRISGGVMDRVSPSKVIDYIHSLECAEGGYCFYGLEEPNLADTFFAIQTLALLSNSPQNPLKTIAFVQRFFDHPHGLPGLWGTYYGLRILDFFKIEIRTSELDRFLSGHFEKILSRRKSGSLESLSHLTELIGLIKCPVEESLKERARKYVFQFQQKDFGFGKEISNLRETYFALSILKGLGYPIDPLCVSEFIFSCEKEEFGFTNVPGTTLAFLEDIYFGLLSSEQADYRPRYPESILKFILDCQTRGLGFRRSHVVGIATLEYTHMAIASLKMLQDLQKKTESVQGPL